MISFKRWALSGKLDARQADDYTAEFRVSGLLPGYTWELLWNYGSNLDVIPLELNDGGDIGIATLTKDNLAFSGTYVAQLRATTPNGGIKHTDKLELNIPDSFTEDAHWPVVPRAFSEYVEGVADDVANEINARIKPPFFATVSHTSYAEVVAAYEAKRFIVAVDNTGDTYAMIHHEPGKRFEFGGLNPITGQAKYWELRFEDGHNVWATGTKNYARSNTIDTSYSIPTCKAVYDALTKYYDKTAVDNAIAAAKATAAQALADHNADPLAHPAIRQLITELANRLNALADSDDATLDQLSEIVAYIKSNKSLIDAVTTSKVSVSDIVNSLTSTATNKPLSAAQGAVLKAAVDALEAEVEASKVLVLDPDNLPENAFPLVAEAYNARRLCCMRASEAGYLFLQSRFAGEDYYTFSAIGKDGKLVKNKLYSNNALSGSEISDISNVFIGDDNTTYSQWRNHIDAGQVCVWRSRVYRGDFYYQSTGTEGLVFIQPSRSLVKELIKTRDNTTAQYLGRIPANPSSAQAGYVLTATATGSAIWAPPTGGSGGGAVSPTVITINAADGLSCDKTYAEIAAAVEAYSTNGTPFVFFTPNGSTDDVAIGDNGEILVNGIKSDFGAHITYVLKPDDTVTYTVEFTPLTVRYTYDSRGNKWSCDTTYEEIAAAISLGRQIVAYFGEALATGTILENGVGIKHNVLRANADPGETNSQIGIQTFVHLADETVKYGMTTGSLLYPNDSAGDGYPLVMAQEDETSAPEWMTGKELLSKLGIPQPTSEDNGKALVVENGSAVWSEIAGGGGEDEWRIIAHVTLKEETSGVYITEDTEGNALSLREIMLHSKITPPADVPAADRKLELAVRLKGSTNYITTCYPGAVFSGGTKTAYAKGEVSISRGISNSVTSSTSPASYNTMGSMATWYGISPFTYSTTYDYDTSVIDGIRYYVMGNSHNMGVDSEIIIYGR